MDDHTAQRLIALNRTFYEKAGTSFDRTRQTAWPGWRRLLAHLPSIRPLRVLDAGCGNARFARFLAGERIAAHYTGIDFSPMLLSAASVAMTGVPDIEAKFVETDFVTSPQSMPNSPFDFVTLFGVLHHVPGAGLRAALVQALAERVAPGGLLAFTIWRFDRQPRFAAHHVPPPPDLLLEPGDVLLDWRAEGVHAVRYCHALSDAELDTLVTGTGLKILDAYAADGQSGDLNEYRILRRGSAR